uniref:Cullin-associated NEDD8-dissociated protein 1-like n=1 Tax=Hirondellea gigas TaxID=1518452 RepID=A0A6A7GAE3_9CRUS
MVSRFTDRDVDVKVEIFHAIRNLMSATVRKEGIFAEPRLLRMPSIGPPPILVRTVSSAILLEQHVSEIVNGIMKQMQTVDTYTKSAAFSVLRELCIVRSGGLEIWFNQIFPCIVETGKERDTEIRSKALDLLHLILTKHNSLDCVPFIPSLCQYIVDAINHRTTHLKVQGLRCCQVAVNVVRPTFDDFNPELLPPLQAFYESTLAQMRHVDIEQSVKVASISALANILVHFGDHLPLDSLPLFLDRLQNQVTRLAALRALTAISRSPLQIDLSSVKQEALKIVVEFLKQVSLEVKHEAAETLNALLSSSGSGVQSEFPELLTHVSSFISDGDLLLTHLVLDVISTLLESQSTLTVPSEVVEKSFELLASPYLQGSDALGSLQRLFVAMMGSKKSLSYKEILEKITSVVSSGLSVEGFTSVSQCVASVTMKARKKYQNQTVERFLAEIESKDETVSHVALLCIGEIGKHKDLSSTLAGRVVFSAFSKESQELKLAASFALGCISVANLDIYLRDLLEKIHECPKFRYLLLNSLREIITFHHLQFDRVKVLRKHTDAILPLLLENANSQDEGERAIVAECLGKMIIIDCSKVMPVIVAHLDCPSATTRAVVISSIKFSLNGDPQIQGILRSKMEKFLALMNDDRHQSWSCDNCRITNKASDSVCSCHIVTHPNGSDKPAVHLKVWRPVRDVERQAFLTLHAILKHDVQLVASFLHKDASVEGDPRIFKSVFEATKFRPELVKEIDMGVVKAKIDYGLPLRKASFMCMETLAMFADHWISFPSYIQNLSNGLSDPEGDVLMLTYRIFTLLAKRRGADILSELDNLPTDFTGGLKKQLRLAKGNDLEADRARNVLTTAVEALNAINDIPGCASLSKLRVFYQVILKTPLLRALVDKLNEEKKKRVK